MSTMEIEGKSVEEAIETACQRLNLSADQLEIEIVSQGSSGIFGIGTRQAKILVSAKEASDDTPLAEAREILESILAHIQVPTTVRATWADDAMTDDADAVTDRVAVVTLDNPPVNGLGHALRTAIVTAVARANECDVAGSRER